MDVNNRIAAITAKLAAVKSSPDWPSGAEQHAFRLKPVLSESEVVAFERRWRIQLPADYRAFITVVGNGGAGPAYGLFPLQETITQQRIVVPEGFLSTPFPFAEAYNPYGDPRLADYWRRSRERGVSNEEHHDRKLKEITGTIALCDEGCGYMHLLVVSGAARGQMWLDATVSDGGYNPLAASFDEWYERWLDSALAGNDGCWWLSEE